MSSSYSQNNQFDGDSFHNAKQQAAKSLLATDVQNDAEAKKKLTKVLFMSFAFFMLFTAFMSASNLIAPIYQSLGFNSLGKISAFVLYVVFFVALFPTPGIIKNWPYKIGVFVGSFGYLFTLLAGVMTTSCGNDINPNGFYCSEGVVYAVNLICAALNGLTAPVLWISANKYVTGCTTEANRGTYLGLFASFVSGAQLMAGVLSAFVIENFGTFYFYLIATGFVIAAMILFFVLPPVEKFGETEAIESIREKAGKIVELALTKRMRPFLPYIFYVGILLAVYTSFEFEIIDNAVPANGNTDHQEFVQSLILICQAAAGIVASYSAGRFADMMPLKIVLTAFNIFSAVGIVFGFIAYGTANLPLCYVLGIFLGFGYSGALALSNVVMAKDFDGTTESFALSQVMNTMGTIVGLGLSIGLSDYVIPFLCIMAALLGLNQASTFFYRSRGAKKVEESTV